MKMNLIRKKKKPKIYSAKIERITYASGKDYYKATVKGKNFDKDFNVYLGGQKSVKENRENRGKAFAYFDVSDFDELQDVCDLKFYNSSKRRSTYDELLSLKSAPHQYIK